MTGQVRGRCEEAAEYVVTLVQIDDSAIEIDTDLMNCDRQYAYTSCSAGT